MKVKYNSNLARMDGEIDDIPPPKTNMTGRKYSNHIESMYLPLKLVIFHCHVRFRALETFFLNKIYDILTTGMLNKQ